MKKIKNQVKDFVDNDLYEIPDEVSETEALIYDWVVYHFGKKEAENPSWNIHDLAQHLDEMRDLIERIKGDYEPQNTIMYRL